MANLLSMKVLATDPGYDRLGVAVLEQRNGNEVLLYSDCITTPRDISIAERLAILGTSFETLLKEHAPDLVAIESLFFNKNQKTAIAVAEARGILLYLAHTHGAKTCEYSPQQIKIAITGYGKSTKQQVADMLPQLLANIPKQVLDDEYDAIAIGLTCLVSER